eukprot:766994-Hanusia_phi.AAC.2
MPRPHPTPAFRSPNAVASTRAQPSCTTPRKMPPSLSDEEAVSTRKTAWLTAELNDLLDKALHSCALNLASLKLTSAQPDPKSRTARKGCFLLLSSVIMRALQLKAHGQGLGGRDGK